MELNENRGWSVFVSVVELTLSNQSFEANVHKSERRLLVSSKSSLEIVSSKLDGVRLLHRDAATAESSLRFVF
jgi:hypothetical protein